MNCGRRDPRGRSFFSLSPYALYPKARQSFRRMRFQRRRQRRPRDWPRHKGAGSKIDLCGKNSAGNATYGETHFRIIFVRLPRRSGTFVLGYCPEEYQYVQAALFLGFTGWIRYHRIVKRRMGTHDIKNVARRTPKLLVMAALLAFGANFGQAAAIIVNLNIVSGGGGAIYSTAGGTFDIAQLVESATDVNIPSGDDLVLSFTTGASPSLTLTNGATSDFTSPSNVPANTQLYSANSLTQDFSLAGTDTVGSGGVLNLTASQSKPVALNANFFNDLVSAFSLPGNTVNLWTVSGGISGQDIAGTNKILSDTLELTNTSAPEPSSTILFGAGLLGISLLLRKRLIKTA